MKDTYYFSHDYNARTDEKMIKLLKTMKWEGYGLFWALVEKLYEAGGEIESDIDCIAYDLRTESDRIKTLCEDFDLFYQKAGKLRSLSVDRRLQHRAEKSEKARESAIFRWGNANALRPHMKRNAIKERKGKERKEKSTTIAPDKPDADLGKKPVNWDNCKTPQQKLAAYYLKRFSPDIYTGNQLQVNSWFKRHGKALTDICHQCGNDFEVIKKAFDLTVDFFNKSNCNWVPDTVAKHIGDYLSPAKREVEKNAITETEF